MVRSYLVAVFALAVAMPAAYLAAEDKPDKELIQAAWKVESSKDGGKDDSNTNGLILTLKAGGELTASLGDKELTGKYTIDPSKNPKWIDVTVGDATYLGIYELKGDTLRICHGEAGGKRATKFASEADSPNKVLTVLKRQPK